jgi:hypothetical protein
MLRGSRNTVSSALAKDVSRACALLKVEAYKDLALTGKDTLELLAKAPDPDQPRS